MQLTNPVYAHLQECFGPPNVSQFFNQGWYDNQIAVDPKDENIVWTAGAGDSRGPPLIIAGHVIVARRDGVIESRALHSGAIACRVTRATGYDRAGPARAGGLLIFANLTGEIEAIPVRDLVGCPAPP